MVAYSKKILDQAKTYWSLQYGRELSDTETLEIVTNLTRYVEVLLEIDQLINKETE